MIDRDQRTSPFAEVVAPPAPPDLRADVLRACRLRVEAPRPGLIDRVWESSALRWAWALTLVGLLVASLALERIAPSPSFAARTKPRVQMVSQGAGTAELFGMALPQDTPTRSSAHQVLAARWEDGP